MTNYLIKWYNNNTSEFFFQLKRDTFWQFMAMKMFFIWKNINQTPVKASLF